MYRAGGYLLGLLTVFGAIVLIVFLATGLKKTPRRR